MASLTELAGKVKARLKDAANALLADAAYTGAVSAAVLEYSCACPRILNGSITLAAGVADYAAPSGFLSLRDTAWGRAAPIDPWDYSSNSATTFEIGLVDGQLHFTPAPDAFALARFGAAFNFTYRAAHLLDDANPAANTLGADGEQPVILKALSLACAEIAADSTQAEQFVYRYRALSGTYGEMYEEILKKKIRPAVVR